MIDGSLPDANPTSPSGVETASVPTAPPAPEPNAQSTDTPASASLETMAAQPTPDISEEERRSVASEKSRAFRELIPHLADYGLTVLPDPRNPNISELAPIVILTEPFGGSGNSPFRYVAVTDSGIRLTDLTPQIMGIFDQSKLNSRQTTYVGDPARRFSDVDIRIVSETGSSRDRVFLEREATAEEAMQALVRSIQRKHSTSVTTPPAPYSDLNIKDQYRLRDLPGQFAGAYVGAIKEGIGIKKPPPPDPFQEARAQHSLERGAASDALKRFRERYKSDPSPAKPDESFEAAIAREEAMFKTPNTFMRDADRQRIDTATRMTEFLKEPMATIQPASPIPTSQAA